jgi:DNA end-binding protein Ku
VRQQRHVSRPWSRLAKFAWCGRERLGLLRVQDDVIILHSLRWPDEIRSPDELAPKAVELDDDEIERAIALMEAMSEDDVSGYTTSTARAVRPRAKPISPEQALATLATHVERCTICRPDRHLGML